MTQDLLKACGLAPTDDVELTPIESAIRRRKSIDREIEALIVERAKLCRQISLFRSQTSKHTGQPRRVA